jgi:RNA polymerase-binding transcription factor DksA
MLTEAQKEALRSAMQRRMAELRSLIGGEAATEQADRLQERRADVGDYGDEAVGDDLARTEGALVDMHRDEEREIETALARMDKGNYGSCSDCDDPIGFERLRVNPASRRCEPCQRRHEAAAGAPGRVSR